MFLPVHVNTIDVQFAAGHVETVIAENQQQANVLGTFQCSYKGANHLGGLTPIATGVETLMLIHNWCIVIVHKK
jgi:hypothetical protein